MSKTPRVISFVLSLFLGLQLLTLVACSSLEKNSNTPEGAFAIAEEFDKGERYEEALRRYNDVKNKFPYSNYAIRAELAVADVYFKQESYPEAQVAYQSFRELHPKHPQIDYVTFRIGLSFYNQLPTTIDRDLTLANDVIATFDEVTRNFPSSQYAAEAKEKREEALKKLAAKEEYIADFYFKREIYDSALSRYEGLYIKYGGLGFDAKALGRAAICAKKTGDETKAQRYADVLFREHADSKEVSAVKKELSR